MLNFFLIKYAEAEGTVTASTLVSNIKTQIINPILLLLTVAGVLMFIWGVIDMIRNANNEEARTKGKQHMVWGLFGLLVIFAVGGIIRLICNFVGSTSCGI
ncbi:MAG: hypothetical protein HZA25_00255 [Candidatus Niyogibacteria bacterium]|nr:hypothetical protein [Candidatus Niyogibacteria bacterium]